MKFVLIHEIYISKIIFQDLTKKLLQKFGAIQYVNLLIIISQQ